MKRTYSIRYDEHDLRRRIVVAVKPARFSVTITSEAADVLKSKAGSTVSCMNSRCAMRLAAAGAFPHPVYLAVFTKTSAYLVDRLDKNGQPARAIWYKHNDSESVVLNDTVLDRRELLKAVDKMSTITLMRPYLRNGIKNRWATGTHRQAPRREETPRRTAVARGARDRAIAAGILVLPD